MAESTGSPREESRGAPQTNTPAERERAAAAQEREQEQRRRDAEAGREAAADRDAREQAGELTDFELLHPPMDKAVPNPLPRSTERLHADAIEDPEAVPGLGTDDKVMLVGVSGNTLSAAVKTGPAQEAPSVLYDDAAASRDEWVFDEAGQRAKRASTATDAAARPADRHARSDAPPRQQ